MTAIHLLYYFSKITRSLNYFKGCDPSITGRVHSQDAGLPEDGEHDLDPVQGPSGDYERRSADLPRGHRCSTHLHEGFVHGGGETNSVILTDLSKNGFISLGNLCKSCVRIM